MLSCFWRCLRVEAISYGCMGRSKVKARTASARGFESRIFMAELCHQRYYSSTNNWVRVLVSRLDAALPGRTRCSRSDMSPEFVGAEHLVSRYHKVTNRR